MLKFAMPDGSNFDLDYVGPIMCFDAYGKPIAICIGFEKILSGALRKIVEVREDGTISLFNIPITDKSSWGRGDSWDDWRILIKGHEDDSILQRCVACAYTSVSFLQRMVVEIELQKELLDDNESSNFPEDWDWDPSPAR